jgi:hypothetical protein
MGTETVTAATDDEPTATVTPPIDIAWIDDNNGAGPQKLSNSIRCF